MILRLLGRVRRHRQTRYESISIRVVVVHHRPLPDLRDLLVPAGVTIVRSVYVANQGPPFDG